MSACSRESASLAHVAAYRGHRDVLVALHARGVSLCSVDGEQSTPLHKAASQGRLDCVGFLLGVDGVLDSCVNAGDSAGFTPLHLAVLYDHVDVVRLLLTTGKASSTAKNAALFSPFHLAVLTGSTPLISVFIKHAGDGMLSDVATEGRLSALHLGCSSLGRDSYQLLLEAIPTDQRYLDDLLDSDERTPLHYAFLLGRADLVPLLLSHDCDPCRPDKSGAVPTQRSPFTPQEVEELLGQGQAMRRVQLQRRWRALAVTFNQKPKAGIAEGVAKRLIDDTPGGVARFLYDCEHLQKRLVGEYLGELHNLAVLEAYAKLFSFEGLPFEGALRVYLAKFRLPGESQKIERCMENFARHYHAQNPGVFRHEDGAFILAYSTIMLNTDAHNPSVKNRMTKPQFVATNRGIDDGQDLPRDFLESLYDSITSEGIKMEGEGELLLFKAADRKGWVRKQGGRIKTWKKRWFVLSSNCVYYFKEPEDKEPLGIIPLENLDVRPVNAKRFEFEIFSPQKLAGGETSSIKAVKANPSGGGMAKGHHDRYLIAANSQEEMDDWIAAIRSHIVGNPVYLMLQQRSAHKKPSSSSSAAASTSTLSLNDQPSSSSSQSSTASQTSSSSLLSSSSSSSSSVSLTPTPASPPMLHRATIAASSAAVVPPALHAGPGLLPSGTPDTSFQELFFLHQVCQALQTSASSLNSIAGGCEVIRQTSAPDLSYVLINDAQLRVQTFAVHRHAWDETEVVARLLQDAKSVDQKDYQIGKISEHIVATFLRPQLKADWQLRLTGHGLGGCHAVEVYLAVRKHVKQTPKLCTFGQPNHAPSHSMKKSPLVRVLTERDPVGYLFVGVEPVGLELTLLPGAHYSLLTKPAKKLAPRFAADRARAAARDHLQSEYHARLAEKLDGAVLVPVEQT